MGMAEKKNDEIGYEKIPSCVKTDFDDVAKIKSLTASKQSILRSNCFCRDGSGFDNADVPYLEFDETKIAAKCTDLSSSANAGAFADVRKYVCETRISKDNNRRLAKVAVEVDVDAVKKIFFDTIKTGF